MLRPLLVGVLALGGCSAPGGTANALTPDSFTVGRGKGSSMIDGGIGHPWYEDERPVDIESESKSTYMALTWDLPTWDSAETREDRRKLREESVILDLAAEEARLEESDTAFSPPEWLPKVFGGIIGLLLIYVWFKLKRSNGWH